MIHKVKRLLVTCSHFPCLNQAIYDGINKYSIPKDWYQKYNTVHHVTEHYCPEHGILHPGAVLGVNIKVIEL